MDGIALLQLINERYEYKRLARERDKSLQCILGMLINIGAPLNDNVLKFNDKQLRYLNRIKEEIEGTE